MLKWKNPNRRRKIKAVHTDNDFVVGYDLDNDHLTELVLKLKNGGSLDLREDYWYGVYLQTIINCVLENPKFKFKSESEKSNLRDQMAFELCQAILGFDETRGSNIYSYAYRCGYTAACHYYTNLEKDKKLERKIEEVYHNVVRTFGHKVNSLDVNSNNQYIHKEDICGKI